MSIEHQAAAGLKATALARLIGQLASWASTLLVFRLLVPQDYGLMALVATLTGIGTALAEFGLGASMVQAREMGRELLARLAGLALLLHAAMVAIMAVAGQVFAWFYGEPRLALLIQVAALQFVFAGVSAVPYAIAVREMRFGWLARVELLSVLLASVCTLGLALLGAGVWSLIGGVLVSSAARALMLVAQGENVRPSFRLDGLGPHLSYSSQMAATQLLWSVVSQADVLIGGRMLTRDALGFYSVAVHVATLPMTKVMGVINQIAFAAVARLQDERDRLRQRLLQSTRLMMAAAIAVIWGMAAVAPELVPLLIGPQWKPAVPVLQMVSVVIPLRMLMMVLSTAASGVGAANVVLRNTLTAAVVWPICLVIGAQWGAVGLAAAWLLAAPTTFAINSRRIAAVLDIGVAQLMRQAAPSVTAGVIMWLGIVLLRQALGDLSELLRVVPLIGAGAALYIATVLLLDRTLWRDLRGFVASLRDARA